jgi:molybdopterin converting factor subunit 1
MRVKVEFYARLRELAGTPEWPLETTDGATVGEVWRAAVAAHDALAAMTGSVSAAVNAEFATMKTVVRDGDEIAFLPPVSGGARETR